VSELFPEDQARLDKNYNARAPIADFDAVLRGFDENSARARASLPSRLDLAYGPHRDEVADVFLPPSGTARSGAPVMLFLHGGYWRMLTKKENSFVAAALAPAGAVVMVNTYSLCPGVHLDVIVRQCRAFVAWAYRRAAEFGGDPNRIFVSGHSAGGHLAGMMLATDWAGEYGLPADVVKGAVAASGLYDLRPLARAYIREWLHLNDAQAERNSPLLQPPRGKAPVILTVGGNEPAGFLAQTQAYRAKLQSLGVPVSQVEAPGHDHFSVWNEIMQPDSALTRATLAMMGLR
jgi:arylformamidase